MDVVKAKAWKEFFAKNKVVPPAYDRIIRESQTPTSFCIGIKSVDGVPSKTDDNVTQTEYQLRVHLYDIAYKQFFGRSWNGPVQSGKSSSGNVKLSYNQNIYLHTPIHDSNIVLVIELVAIERLPEGKSRRYGKGWTIYRLFSSHSDVPDLSSKSEPKTDKLPIFNGTPRALCHLDDPIESNEFVSLVHGCTLSCNLQTHVALLKVQHLLPVNAIVGTNDIIPGIVDAIRSDTPHKDCLRKPRLMKGMKAFLDKVTVTLYPNIEKFEDELCKLLNEDRLNRDNLVPDGTSLSITERRLLVGVHNGFCYVEEPEVAHLVPMELSQRRGSSLRKTHQRSSSYSSLYFYRRRGSSNLGTTYMLRDRLPLSGLVCDPMFSVVFVLEYLISEPVNKENTKLSMSMNKTQNISVSVRWTAWSPFTKPPAVGEKIQISFAGGPTSPPDELLTYKLPRFDMDSSSTIKDMTGSINFQFIDSQKEMMEGHQTNMSLAVPTYQTSGYTDESRSELIMEHTPGKPPRPGTTSTPVRNANSLEFGTPNRSFNRSVEREKHKKASRSPPPHRNEALQESPIPHYTSAIQASPVPPQYLYQSSGSPAMPYPMHGIPTQPQGFPMAPVGYPMEIRHVSESPGPGGMTIGTDLQELPFTPVHAPVMALPPGSKSGVGLSRAAYARLYSAGFPPILDRHKETAEVVDPSDYVNFVMSKEESDPLQCNEVVFQFLAFSRMSEMLPEGMAENHSCIFFTFQFYKFAHITTERILLGQPDKELSVDKKSQPCILQRLNPDGSIRQGPPGYQIKYVADPTNMKPSEGSLFVRHMSQQTLHIDVWDGDSLLLIGSCAVELKHLCRQGREAVQVTYELDIMATEVSDGVGNYTGDLNRGGSIRPVGVSTLNQGKLHLRLANIGHPVDPKLLPKSRTMPSVSLSGLIKPDKSDMQGSFIGGSLSSIRSMTDLRKRGARAQHLTSLNVELAGMLHSNRSLIISTEEVNKNNRKLERMRAVRENLNKSDNSIKAVQSYSSFKQQKAERARDLKVMEAFRQQSKSDGIRNMLNQAITTECTIHPSMGTTEFFEFELRNPGNMEATVAIQIDNHEISVITDPREWRHFKTLSGIQTPLEEGMFNLDESSKTPQVFLRPKETVFIPFKYLSFEANHACSPETPGSAEINAGLKSSNAANFSKSLSTRICHIKFSTVGDGKLINILSLRVEPEPHVIDQTFRFHQPEQSFLKKSIRLPPFHNAVGRHLETSTFQHLMVRCSDPNVICESYKRQSGEPQDVFIKAAVGMSPQQKKFYVCIYTDPFLAKPEQVWQFYVHALQRVDVSCVEGQTTRLNLILRGTQSARLVRCFSSHQKQMQVLPKDAFMLAPGAVHELHIGVRPLHSGTKFFYIHVVDVECHQLVRNWLVCVNCTAPVVSKTFELQLPAGGGKGSNKRISYTNPYPQPKTFILANNRNDLLMFKEDRLEMLPKETRIIGLRFMPSLSCGSAEIMIFINDEDDKNEETFCVKATYLSEDDY